MKLKKLLSFFTFSALALFQAFGQGYIVQNGVITNYPNGLPGEISVVHDPTNFFYTGFQLQPRSLTPPSSFTNTFRFNPVVDVGVRVFLVGSNQPVSLQPILGNTYTELQSLSTYVFNNNVPFLVGLYTGNDQFAPVNGVYEDPLFGWARLVNNRGIITLLDSALSYKTQGIYAGTENFVPEPNGASICLLGVLLMGLCANPRMRSH